jgi:hypothetical protein
MTFDQVAGFVSAGGLQSRHNLRGAPIVERGTTGGLVAISLAAALTLFVGGRTASAQGFGGVLTFHNDNFRSGENLKETQLTPANVNTSTFGLSFMDAVDGYMYAEPLYVPSVNLGAQGTHNVVIVATEHDSVYAFDADNPAPPLWQTSFINASKGIKPIPSTDTKSTDLVPEIGITSTPVIDGDTGIIYVVSNTKTVPPSNPGASPVYTQQLHALNIANGQEISGSPVTIDPQVSGSGGTTSFNALIEGQRAALTLVVNGDTKTVYVAWASHGDNGPYHGLVVGYDATSLAQVAVFNVTPHGVQGGIWQSCDGPGVDADGNLFVLSGNGTFDANTGGDDYGDSFMKLAPGTDRSLSVASYFTPSNQAMLDSDDLDLGSGGPLLLPDQTTGPVHLIVSGGKNGTIFLLNRDNMGAFNSSGDQVVQEITQSGGIFSTPTYFNGMVFIAPSFSHIMMYSLTGGLLSTSPVSTSSFTLGDEGSTTVISADGNNNAILWLIDATGYFNKPVTPAVLHAVNPADLSTEYYNSNMVSSDVPGSPVKFSVPTVANGKVYVGTQTQLAVYALRQSSAPRNVPIQLKPSPASLNFATVTLNRSKTKSITVKNPSGRNGLAIMVEGVSTTGPFSSSGCIGTIAPGQKCKITVTFNANQSGTPTGTLTIMDNSTSGALNVSLSGKVKAPKVPTVVR